MAEGVLVDDFVGKWILFFNDWNSSFQDNSKVLVSLIGMDSETHREFSPLILTTPIHSSLTTLFPMAVGLCFSCFLFFFLNNIESL